MPRPTPPQTTEAAADHRRPTAEGGETTDGEGAAPAGDAAMTDHGRPRTREAVWEDGTPITVADIECTWRAQLNTPGSIETVGYDVIKPVGR